MGVHYSIGSFSMATTIKIDLRHIKTFTRGVKSARAPELRRGLLEGIDEYTAFVRNRLFHFGRGSGNWPPLNEDYRDWKVSVGYPREIMRRTQLMLHVLNPFSRKYRTIRFPGRLRIVCTYGLNAVYKLARKRTTVAKVISHHHQGRSVPQRLIIVSPDQKTKLRMARRYKIGIRAYDKRIRKRFLGSAKSSRSA